MDSSRNVEKKSFLERINTWSRKVRKSGWKWTILILFIAFSVDPSPLAGIPFIYDAFMFTNNLYGFVMYGFIVKVLAVPVLGDILGFIGELLPLVAMIIPLLWIVSLPFAFITGLMIKIRDDYKAKPHSPSKRPKRPKKANRHKEETEDKLNLIDKIRAYKQSIKDKRPGKEGHEIITIECEQVFFPCGETYLRVQRMYATDLMSENKDELLSWGPQRRLQIPFTCNGVCVEIPVYLDENDIAVFKLGEEIKKMELNSPMGVSLKVDDTLVMVLTWIGDVHG